MKVLSLLYHDVVAGSDYGSSGFAGADADIYKLGRDAFERHLNAIAKMVAPVTIVDALEQKDGGTPVLLTFDDGGAGTWTHIAPMLEERNWRGHFFIPTNWIGKPGFLDAAQIRKLHERGHIIGSHSSSHPMRISSLPRPAILREWSDSVARLSEIVGEQIWTASVPAGYYGRVVGETAEEAGIRALFYSEPKTSVERVGGCQLFGRYSIQQATPPETAAAIAAEAVVPRAKQYLFWELKKILKRGGGEAWLKFRKTWLGRSAR